LIIRSMKAWGVYEQRYKTERAFTFVHGREKEKRKSAHVRGEDICEKGWEKCFTWGDNLRKKGCPEGESNKELTRI